MGGTGRSGLAAALLASLVLVGCQRGAAVRAGADVSSVTYQDREGVRHALADHRGKIIVVDVWATWCPPCRKSLPEVADLQRQASSEVVVLPISVDRKGWEDVGPFLEANPSLGLTAFVPAAADSLKPFGPINGIPTTLIVDRRGRLKERWSGYYPGRVEKAIQAALAEGRP